MCSQSARSSFKLNPGDCRKWFNPALACLSEVMTVWGKPFSEWSLLRIEQCPPRTPKPPSLPPLTSPLCCEWCATEAKPRFHAKIHLTTATLTGLQPEDHNFASGSCGTKTTRGDCRGLDIQQAALSGQNRPRLLLESQFNRWRTDLWRLYHCKWQGTIIYAAV